MRLHTILLVILHRVEKFLQFQIQSGAGFGQLFCITIMTAWNPFYCLSVCPFVASSYIVQKKHETSN